MFSLVEEYLSGGVTQSVLCEREGLKKGTFKYWHRKYRLEQLGQVQMSTPINKSKRSDFLSISVSEVIESTSTYDLELCYPNGVRLHFNTVLDTNGLLTIKQLLSCLD